jgi:hypothetical protein
MDTSPIPAARIKGLRLTCRGCGVEILLPVTARDAPPKCFNCYTDFPAQGILSALRELKWLHDRDEDRTARVGFWVDPQD